MASSISPVSSTAPVSAGPRHGLIAQMRRSGLFRDFQRSFEATTRLPLSLRAAGSFGAPLADRRKASAFCTLMASRSRTCAACLEAQARLEGAARDDTATITCHLGLHESAVPLRMGQEVVAFLQTGQLLFHDPGAAEVRRAVTAAAQLAPDADRAELESAYRQAPVVERRRYGAMLQLLGIFARHFAASCNQQMIRHAFRESPVITRARAFLGLHHAEELSLRDVAHAVGMSPFYFCKVFRRETGFKFTEYLSRIRIEAVKQSLLKPHIRINEAAYAAGFQSLSQFNRIFCRIVGQPPSAYRRQLHASLDAATGPAGARGHAA